MKVKFISGFKVSSLRFRVVGLLMLSVEDRKLHE